MKTILGIDNGLLGALAFYNETELMIYDMPIFRGDKNTLDLIGIRELIKGDLPAHCFVEKLTPMPQVSGKTCFSMGYSEGVITGLLASLEVPYTLVRPMVWKKFTACPADKDGARKRASELLPQFAHNWPLKKNDGRAEAALIALYGHYSLSRITL